MPFYRMDFGEGKTGVVHIRMRRAPAPCVALKLETDDPGHGARCGRMSVALCDHQAGQDVDGKALTCDAPMCERHRTSVGPNVNHCPRHAKQQTLPEVFSS